MSTYQEWQAQDPWQQVALATRIASQYVCMYVHMPTHQEWQAQDPWQPVALATRIANRETSFEATVCLSFEIHDSTDPKPAST
jgi:hypothetical protein